MTTTALTSNIPDFDLRLCDKEPIHIPGSIQPHGVLIAIDFTSLRVQQVSNNIASHFKLSPEDVLGQPLSAVFPETSPRLESELRRIRLSDIASYVTSLQLGERRYHVLAHRHHGPVILEFELVAPEDDYVFRELYQTVNSFVSRLSGLGSSIEVAQIAAEQVRELSRFDRVLVYQFDSQWNGTVIAESRNQNLPAYMDLRFPASDIPSQARDLYRLNPTRVIPDGAYSPAALTPELNPQTGQPLDLSFAALRSVSPVHREYMRNMGTAASMSISILRHGQLWGLVSCHNKDARPVSFDVRKACEFIGQVISVQTEAHERNALISEKVRLKSIVSELLAHMAHHENFADGLISSGDALLEFARADGAALLHDGECNLIGRTPGQAGVEHIVRWLSENAPREDVYHSDNFGRILPSDDSAIETSGLLAVRISKLHHSYVLWFRPEVIHTVRWGGDPTRPVDNSNERMHPRNSFEMWKEVVRHRSLPFSPSEIEAAVELRNAIVGIVLRKAEEMAELTSQLRRSNKELEAFSYSVSHDLRAPFRHIVGYSELLREREADHLSTEGLRYVGNIIDSAEYAGKLVDNLLNFSRMARASLSMLRINLKQLVEEVQRQIAPEAKGRKVEWKISDLPLVIADPIFLRMAIQNLLSNALKYTRDREVAFIEVSSAVQEQENVICVRDNGVGFDMRYADKLFGVFQRLHRVEEFDGTGIGLANVRRIIERHGGRTWAEGEIGKGAAFYFSLPAIAPKED